MKHFLALSLILCLSQLGCNQVQKYPNDNFPKSMVGVWKCDPKMGNWGFKFEADGTVPKLIHAVAGQVIIAEGGIYEEGPDPNNFCVFDVLPCVVDYRPANRTLKVKIEVPHFLMRFPHGDLEGHMTDYIEGVVSEDCETWTAKWLNYCWFEDADPPDIETIEANPIPLVFHKVDFDFKK